MKVIPEQNAKELYKTLIEYIQSGQSNEEIVKKLKIFLEHEILPVVPNQSKLNDKRRSLNEKKKSIAKPADSLPGIVISGILIVLDTQNAIEQKVMDMSSLDFLYLLRRVALTVKYFSDVEVPLEIRKYYDVSFEPLNTIDEKPQQGKKNEKPKSFEVRRVYKIGQTGPAGGIVFFDKGVRESGWRYLESAPHDIGPAKWGEARLDEQYLSLFKNDLGSGKQNTDHILKKLENESGRAAQLCQALDTGGYKDWYLPNMEELYLLFTNLKQKGQGNFLKAMYWSSSIHSVKDDSGIIPRWYLYPCYIDFEYGHKYSSNDTTPSYSLSVRAIRAF